LDKEADAAGTGFFCIIENTCTDGWGHSHNNDTKVYSMMNEVQCFDEGVAIAVKYVLEHPDTLLVVTADHDTGNLTLREGWENDYSLMKANSTDHSTKTVPCIAFGAGADKFSAANIAEAYGLSDGSVHEGWITGQIIGQLMGDDDFGQPEGYPN
ncbi:MAG: alkaline phosphatase, partial [Spirochaetales bacterium]|nr:alkaline phosphatase [Spirochaetales bacterium]